MNIDSKIPHCANFSYWEFFVTEQPSYKPDKRGYSALLFGEFMALPESERKEIWQNLTMLGQRLQALRDITGFTIGIDSGWRSIQLNRMIGGAKNSLHLKGLAADPKLSKPQMRVFVNLVDNWSGGMGYAPKDFSQAHIDIGKRARWFY